MFRILLFCFSCWAFQKKGESEEIEKKVYCRSMSDSKAGICSGKDLRRRVSVVI
jgi:hypothetical protein